jgi:hypothetical protein
MISNKFAGANFRADTHPFGYAQKIPREASSMGCHPNDLNLCSVVPVSCSPYCENYSAHKKS